MLSSLMCPSLALGRDAGCSPAEGSNADLRTAPGLCFASKRDGCRKDNWTLPVTYPSHSVKHARGPCAAQAPARQARSPGGADERGARSGGAAQMVGKGFTDVKEAQYLAPAFKFDEDEHAAVMQEAASMDRVLAGHQARPRERRPSTCTHTSLLGEPAPNPGGVREAAAWCCCRARARSHASQPCDSHVQREACDAGVAARPGT